MARFVEHAAISRTVVASGYGSSFLQLEALPTLIFVHACFVVIRACARPGLWRYRRAFQASVALIIVLWFVYYINCPHLARSRLYLCLYAFLVIDLFGEIDTHAMRRRPHVLTLAAALPWAVIIAPYWAKDLEQAFFATRPKPEGTLVSGIWLPEKGVRHTSLPRPNISRRKRAADDEVVYVTPHSFLMPELSGVRSASTVWDFASESHTYKLYMDNFDRLTSRSDLIYIDIDGLENDGWAFGGIYRKLRKDLQASYQFLGVEHGWELWSKSARSTKRPAPPTGQE